MLTVTPLKAGLVFYFFMHLKWEKPFLKSMVFVALALLTLFIAMIFSISPTGSAMPFLPSASSAAGTVDSVSSPSSASAWRF